MRALALFLALALWSCQDDGKEQAPQTTDEAATLWNGKGFAGRCEKSAVSGDKTTFYTAKGDMEEPFRSVAVLTMSNNTLCSAVLIAPDRLVSAAHCFEGKTSIVSARFKDAVSDLGTTVGIESVTLHPDYKKAQMRGETLALKPELASYDVALIKLTAPVMDRPAVQIASANDLHTGKLVALVGYGDTGLGAGTKRFAQSHVGQVIDSFTTRGRTFRDLLLLDSSLATGACQGDSGGGVFVSGSNGKYQLIGVVHGVNDVLYPGLPVQECSACPNGIGIAALLEPHRLFLEL